MIDYDSTGYVIETTTGIRCGSHGRFEKVRHANVDSVRECFRIHRSQDLQQQAEIAAEQAYERQLEDAGREESLFQDEMEARLGVIDFGTAYRMACPELFLDEKAS